MRPQYCGHLVETVSHRGVERGRAGFVGGIHAGSAREQQFHYLQPAHRRGNVEWRRAGFAFTGFRIRSVIKQQRNQVAMPAERSIMQRRASVGIM